MVKKVHADGAARQAAYRAGISRIDLPLDKELADKLAEIASAIDVPRTVLIESMLKFALTNHDWARFGLTHKTRERKG